MLSVRITAAGAVAVACLGLLTTPVRACDERYLKKCEKISAAAAAAEEADAAAPTVRRKSAGRMRVVFSVRSRHGRTIRRSRAPEFAAVVKRDAGMVLASTSTRMTTLMPESALARRFRGFIDPQPMAQNAFESLRKPQLVAINLDATPAIPVSDAAAPAPKMDTPAPVADAAPMAKQDKIVASPVAAEKPLTRSITLATAPIAKPVAVAEAVVAAPLLPAAPQTKPQAMVTEAPMPAPAEPPSRFSIHQLVLALCGALGAAGALRFIVGA